MTQKTRSTYVITDPTQILAALVGLKDVEVLHLERRGPDVELAIEQVVGVVRCPACRGPARVKDRPTVRYIDLPVYGSPDAPVLEEAPDALCEPGLPQGLVGARLTTASRPRTAC